MGIMAQTLVKMFLKFFEGDCVWYQYIVTLLDDVTKYYFCHISRNILG